MTLIRCPGCSNTVARESTKCPVCGCNFTAARIRHYVRWAIFILIMIYLFDKLVLKNWHRHSKHAMGTTTNYRIEV